MRCSRFHLTGPAFEPVIELTVAASPPSHRFVGARALHG
jgi:hypothetical protein